MLESMACSTPVAVYPVDGPLEVLGQSRGAANGSVLRDDLLTAWCQALAVPWCEPRNHATGFSWE